MVVNGSLAGSSPLNPEIWGLSRLVIGGLAFSDQGPRHLLQFLENSKGYSLLLVAICNLVFVLEVR